MTRQQRQLKPSVLGLLVNDLMINNFSNLLQLDFTANMEAQLDKIEEGDRHWVDMLRSFYGPFEKELAEAEKNIDDMKTILDEPTDYVCEKCGGPMVKKLGKFGYFLACSGFPDCRNAQSLPLGKCPMPTCTGNVIKRSTKRGREFFGCSHYPDCEFTSWDAPVADKKCPKCDKPLFAKKQAQDKDNKKENVLLCLNPECGYSEPISENDQ